MAGQRSETAGRKGLPFDGVPDYLRSEEPGVGERGTKLAHVVVRYSEKRHKLFLKRTKGGTIRVREARDRKENRRKSKSYLLRHTQRRRRMALLL